MNNVLPLLTRVRPPHSAIAQNILETADGVYMNGDAGIARELDPGVREDLLADHIREEIIEVLSYRDDLDLQGAAKEAHYILEVTRDMLSGSVMAMKSMSDYAREGDLLEAINPLVYEGDFKIDRTKDASGFFFVDYIVDAIHRACTRRSGPDGFDHTPYPYRLSEILTRDRAKLHSVMSALNTLAQQQPHREKIRA